MQLGGGRKGFGLPPTIPCPACSSPHSTQRQQGGGAGGLLSDTSPNWQGGRNLPTIRAEGSTWESLGELLVLVQNYPRWLKVAVSWFPPWLELPLSWDCTDEQVGHNKSKVSICICPAWRDTEQQGEVQAGKQPWSKAFQVPVIPQKGWCGAGEVPALLLDSLGPRSLPVRGTSYPQSYRCRR